MKTIFIVAGESSGDMHGAALTQALLQQDAEVRVTGIGGGRMLEAGAELVADLTAHATVGFVEGIRNFRRIFSTYRSTIKLIERDRPDAIVLIDYPEFNLRLAKHAKRLGIPIIYYISPQVWAWRSGRVETVRKYVDKMLVIFPFEEEFYRKHGVEVEFVGHPLVKILEAIPDRQTARTSLGLRDDETVIGLLPGSRRREVQALLPIISQAARLIRDEIGRPVTFVCAKAPGLDPALFEQGMSDACVDVRIVDNQTYDVMRASDLLITASGTATVEAMILGAPMVVVYTVSYFTYLLAKQMMKVDRFVMVNLIAGEDVVPELLQQNATPRNIANEAISILTTDRLQTMSRKLAETTAKLNPSQDDAGPADVPALVAARVLEFADRRG